MGYILSSSLRYNYLGSDECVVYKIDSSETLLLERRAANILESLSTKPTMVDQLKACDVTDGDFDSEILSLNEVLNHLAAAGLVKVVV